MKTVLASSFGVSDQFKLILYFTDDQGGARIEICPFECVDFKCIVSKSLDVPEIDNVSQFVPTWITC